MSKYKVVKLKEIATAIAGQSPKSEFYSEVEGIPFLQGNRTFGMKYPFIDTYTTKVTKLADKNDILMSVRAPVGDLNIANCDLCIGRGLSAIKAKNEDQEFLFYALKHNVKNLLKQGSGTTYSSVNKEIINNFDLIVPEDETSWKDVSKLLSEIDKKIELNNKINQELEEMVKTLYDYWFVQFDFPDENGKPYKSSNGKMVWSEELKRDIPEGWEVKNLGDIADIKAGGDKPKVISKLKTENYQIPIYSNGVTDEGLYGFTNLPKIMKESITVSARGTIGFTVIRIKPFVPIIRLIAVTPKNEFELEFLYERIKMLEFEDSGSVQKQLTVPQISKLKLVVPNSELIERYHSITNVGTKKIESKKEENQRLSELRDWLLPMLMNGQVKVK